MGGTQKISFTSAANKPLSHTKSTGILQNSAHAANFLTLAATRPALHCASFAADPFLRLCQIHPRPDIAHPGPLVIDIEKLLLKGSPEAARHNAESLATLADWAHAAAPRKVIGFYGTNTLSRVAPSDLPYARGFARHVDAFFLRMYTFDDDRPAWEKQ